MIFHLRTRMCILLVTRLGNGEVTMNIAFGKHLLLKKSDGGYAAIRLDDNSARKQKTYSENGKLDPRACRICDVSEKITKTEYYIEDDADLSEMGLRNSLTGYSCFFLQR